MRIYCAVVLLVLPVKKLVQLKAQNSKHSIGLGVWQCTFSQGYSSTSQGPEIRNII